MPASPLARYVDLRAAAIARAPDDPGPGLCRALSDALDAALAALFPADRDEAALVAVGGYGRRDLCLFSDIDLMLLCRDRPDPALVDAVFYPLWDAGLKVGHAVRTLPQAYAAAQERLETLTALLDARHLAGSTALVEQLRDGLRRRAVRRRSAIAAELREAELARRAAEPYQLLETNLKEGRGGLRSFNRLRWLGALGLVEPDAATMAGEAHATVLAARNALHAAAGRAQDVWLLEQSAGAARWLGVEADPFAARLYLALREIDRAADLVVASEPAQRSPVRLLRAARRTVRRRGSRGTIAHDAPTLRSVFQYAASLAQEGAERLPPEGATLVAAAHGASWTAADRDGLLALLRSGDRGAALLEELARVGWLERTLPEWRHTRGLPQHTPYHLHPLDVHLRRTAAEAVALAEGTAAEPWCRTIADELGALDEVLLAGLLHDLGKGWPGDHAETGATAAAAIARRARFDADTAHTVAVAVRHHLLLPHVATRRDISDERVVATVADSVGRARTLRVLCLLSVADSRATGPAVWGAWKASLLHDLYARTLRLLEAREGATPQAAPPPDALEHLLSEAGDRVPHAELRRHVAAMPPGYTRAFGVADILRHVALMRDLAPDSARYDARDEGDAHDLALALPDRPGLIALVAGVLALHNLSVLEGRFFTRADGVALQALQLVDAHAGAHRPDRWPRVAADLDRALRDELPLEQRLEEKVRAYRRARRDTAEVRVDADPGGPFTVLEVHASDRVGLLYAITRTLYACGLDVQFAKVDTQGHDVVDVFYVRDLSGAPLRDGERIRAVRATLLAAIGG